jgi:hypothetical protein
LVLPTKIYNWLILPQFLQKGMQSYEIQGNIQRFFVILNLLIVLKDIKNTFLIVNNLIISYFTLND